ncbi:pyrroline-5-carboxylate reductase [bacterium]|nr:pyrroline-5-carboxylate reductase [Rubripirellula sp.]MDA7864986.1 pyrroline-5-carboxylate reductase [bacterium]MDB4621811.1 pyrroline-5-carboxylate reductase [Rubripirellula sp.]MDB4625002.1 pyrroline-5-carboxylate reductase [Rubripirellula sp.]
MSVEKLAVIGGGQMGRALVGGIVAGEVISASQVVLVEPDATSRKWWTENHPLVGFADLATAVAQCDAALLAVKPNILLEVIDEVRLEWRDKLVISIAAGIGLDDLSHGLGHSKVARVMPNTPSLVRQGASGYCCGSEVSSEDRVWIQAVLDSVGLAVEVAETQMDAVTGLSGSGPAYVCIIIEALADGGVLAGLPRPLAMKLATQTVLGTATMIAETKRHPGELKDAVASPGGTTIEAISVLEQNGIRGALIEAVAASAERSREMGEDD